MLSELAAGKPDAIVFELGDGILGTYGVDAILECPDIRARAERRDSLGERSGGGMGRGEAAARAVRDRALRGHGSRHRQSGRRRDHRSAGRRPRLQRTHRRRGAR